MGAGRLEVRLFDLNTREDRLLFIEPLPAIAPRHGHSHGPGAAMR